MSTPISPSLDEMALAYNNMFYANDQFSVAKHANESKQMFGVARASTAG